MKIILIGEYSSFYRNLKYGLERVGHDCVVASTDCGWMNIVADINLSSKLTGVAGRASSNYIMPLMKLRNLERFDVVQFISPVIFGRRFYDVNKHVICDAIKKIEKSFLSVAGDDCYYLEGCKRMRYSPRQMAKELDPVDLAGLLWENEDVREWNRRMAEMVTGVIPIAYDYALGYRIAGLPNLMESIPLPIDLSAIPRRKNKPGNRLVFFHGLNREGFKGTPIVRAAFEILEKRYPNDVRCIIAGRMPLREYLKLFEDINVNVDQLNSYSYGMNALYGLAHSHVVVTGAEEEAIAELKVDSGVLHNGLPEVDKLVQTFEQIIENRKHMETMGDRSRDFVERFHDCELVALKYLSAWNIK
jgi:glycosyltransferase involved in cell wall biosynthesis